MQNVLKKISMTDRTRLIELSKLPFVQSANYKIGRVLINLVKSLAINWREILPFAVYCVIIPFDWPETLATFCDSSFSKTFHSSKRKCIRWVNTKFKKNTIKIFQTNYQDHLRNSNTKNFIKFLNIN